MQTCPCMLSFTIMVSLSSQHPENSNIQTDLVWLASPKIRWLRLSVKIDHSLPRQLGWPDGGLFSIYPWPLKSDLCDTKNKCCASSFSSLLHIWCYFLLTVVVCYVSVSPVDVSVMWHVHAVPQTQRALFMQFRGKKTKKLLHTFANRLLLELPCLKSQIFLPWSGSDIRPCVDAAALPL